MADQVPSNLKARMKASYDAIAPTYSEKFTDPTDPVRLSYLERLFEAFRSSGGTANPATVLELGCGAGVPATKHLLESQDPLFHVTGNDLSTTQLDLAGKALAAYKDRLVLVPGDMLALSFPDHSFDAVTGFYSILHLPRDEQTLLVRSIARWLKPGGLFLATFGIDDMPAEVQETWLDHEKGWMFWSGWGCEGTVKMVEEAGLKILVREVKEVVGDATFLWILAKKEEVGQS